MPKLFQRNGVYAITRSQVVFYEADFDGLRNAIFALCCQDEENILIASVRDGLVYAVCDREPR